MFISSTPWLILFTLFAVDASTGNGDGTSTNISGMSMGKYGKVDTQDTSRGESSPGIMKSMGTKAVKGEINESKMMGSMFSEKAAKDKQKQNGNVEGAINKKLTLRIMSYNIWGGGANEGKPINETVNAILAAAADIIGVQETRLESDPCTAEYCPAVGDSVVGSIANALGFYYYDQTAVNVALWSNGVLSRYPILNATKNDLGVKIDVGGEFVYAYNIHLTDYPYQPCKYSIYFGIRKLLWNSYYLLYRIDQVLNISYGNATFLQTEEELIAAAEDARGPALELFFEDLEESDGATASFVFGDFNEPSFRDWNKEAFTTGQQPLKVQWPTTLAIEKAGFVDAYREVYPNVVAKPAFTWTPTSNVTDPEDHHDRIDFVFAKADRIRVTDAAIVGEMSPEADIVVVPWPSDHRAVVAEVEISV